MFNECNSLSSLSELSKWDTSNIINMRRMFNSCESLLYLPDISNWNVNYLFFYNKLKNIMIYKYLIIYII